jgi:hypothetical protein
MRIKPHRIPAGHGIGSYRLQLEAIADEIFHDTGEHLSVDDCMDMVDIAIDAARGDARGPEAEKALAAAVRMGFVKSH